MKLSFTDGTCQIVATNPDDRLRADFASRFRNAVMSEVEEFLEEVAVELKKVKPGKTKTLRSRPIVVTITREAEDKSKLQITA